MSVTDGGRYTNSLRMYKVKLKERRENGMTILREVIRFRYLKRIRKESTKLLYPRPKPKANTRVSGILIKDVV